MSPPQTSLFCHHIVGLENLFHEPIHENGTFPVGCTMVLSGPPGAGKTTFALGLVRSMLRNCSPEATPKETEKKGRPKHIAYYISTEVKRDRLRRMFDSRGWFAEKEKAANEGAEKKGDVLFEPNPDSRCTSGLHVISPPLEIERPVKSSEELVNFIVRQIAVQPPPEEGQFVFIIVDSITALFKNCASGDSRRQVHELVHRLRGQFAGNSSSGSPIGKLGMILLLSEEGLENKDSPGMETYVADIVFNLNLKSLTMGTRLRTLEITKSQGANMMMGTHTWQIVTAQSLDRLVAGRTLKDKVLKAVTDIEARPCEAHNSNDREGNKKKLPWGTLMVASRPYFHPIEGKEPEATSENEPKALVEKEEACGVCGLDEMLRFDPDYWFMDPLTVIKDRQNKRAKGPPSEKKDEDESEGMHTSIKAGNVTMLVGEPGTGKTSLCYHIIASHLAKNKNPRAGNKVEKDENIVALLVGFEHDFRPSFNAFVKRFRFASKNVLSLKEDEGAMKEEEEGCLGTKDCERCEIIYRPRSGLHFNLLLLELRTWLTENATKDKRVAIDGISHLAFTHSRPEFSKMLDALVTLFAEYPRENNSNPKARKASLFLTYEAMQNDSVLDADTLRLPADNIIRFSHKVIEDTRRTAVTMIKSSHPEYDNMVRELVLNHEEPAQTYICSGFDAYSGMLEGRLRKSEVVLQLFQENDREQAYNLSLQKHLNELLPYQIVLRDFSRFDMTSALDGKGDHVKLPSGDVQISHTDEWWLAHKVQVLGPMANEARQLKKNGKTEAESWREFRKYVAKKKMTKLAGFVSASEGGSIFPGDFWCFEMEKSWISNNVEGQEKQDIGPYGLPSYLDFGMLCVHRDAVLKAEGPTERPDCHTDYTWWEDYDKAPWPALAIQVENNENRRKYASLLNQCMLPWCTPERINVKEGNEGKEWFKSPEKKPPTEGDTPTLVDLMGIAMRSAKASGKKTGEIRYGFAWDSRTPETSACFLYELAWAFGGTQHLFAEKDPEDHLKNQKAVRRALSFIGFLVHEGLMPACPTLTDTTQSAFSRHYFSTYIDVVNRASIDYPRRDKMNPSHKMKLPQKVDAPILLSLGFMPPGPDMDDWHSEDSIKKDRKIRQKRLDLRQKKAQQSESSEGSAPTPQQVQKYFPKSPNPNDIAELEKWSEFRKILDTASEWGNVLDDGGTLATKGKGKDGNKTEELYKLRTGYGCCGAWMVGVKSPAGAPGLAQVLLQEITSLNFAKKRARMGAGLPARQDFYRYYGDRPVTGMEYLTWNEMLMYLGGTSRRRDRIYVEPDKEEPVVPADSKTSAKKTSSPVDPAAMHRLIHHALVEIMHVAGRAQHMGPEDIITSAENFTESLFTHVAKAAKM